MRRHKRLCTLLIVFLIIITVSLFCIERYLIRKVATATDNHITIGSIKVLPPFIVKLKKVNISYTPFPRLSLKKLSIHHIFTGNAFAFSGPGSITIQDGQKGVKIKGNISGNYKEGTLDIGKTTIIIEDLGSFDVKGGLEQWGKEGVNLVIDLKDTEIEEIKKAFNLNLPFRGKVSGVLILDYSKKKEKSVIRFDITVKELLTNEGNKFTAFIKGVHNIKEGKTDIEDGKLLNGKGGQILFSGFIDRENFNLNFETQDMPLEDLLKLIPGEIRKKYNISISNGSLSMKNFNIEKVKKKSV